MRKTQFITLLTAITVIAGIAMGIYLFTRPAHGNNGLTLPRTQYPVHGIDISAHNGFVDFGKMTNDSIDFVIIKATEGTSFKDSRFHTNYRNARNTGIRIGAYHFFRFDTDGKMQALNLINSVMGLDLDFPLMIDVEEWNNARGIPRNKIIDRLSDMVSYLETNGYNLIIYSNKDGFNDFIRNRFSEYPLWICSFTNPPISSEWVFWQYSHCGKINGIDGKVDLNTFNGSRPQWLEWLSNHPAKAQ